MAFAKPEGRRPQAAVRRWVVRFRLRDVPLLPPEDSIDDAIRELFRICRIGVVCGSIATDMTSEIIESEDLFYGVGTFASMPEWGEYFTRNGFQLAIQDTQTLRRVWKIEEQSNEGAAPWYPDAETMRYCFFSKPGAR